MARGLKLTPQPDPDVARLRREVERDHRVEIEGVEARIAAVEARAAALEDYIAGELIPWLDAFRTFAGYGTAPPSFP